MAKVTLRGKGNAASIANILSNEIQNSALSCSIIDSVTRTAGETVFYVMVFEKYYMRASNRASLTVVVTGNGDDVVVDAIGSGGGQGALFRFSWGAEENFVNTVSQILRRHGFQ